MVAEKSVMENSGYGQKDGQIDKWTDGQSKNRISPSSSKQGYNDYEMNIFSNDIVTIKIQFSHNSTKHNMTAQGLQKYLNIFLPKQLNKKFSYRFLPKYHPPNIYLFTFLEHVINAPDLLARIICRYKIGSLCSISYLSASPPVRSTRASIVWPPSNASYDPCNLDTIRDKAKISMASTSQNYVILIINPLPDHSILTLYSIDTH